MADWGVHKLVCEKHAPHSVNFAQTPPPQSAEKGKFSSFNMNFKKSLLNIDILLRLNTLSSPI